MASNHTTQAIASGDLADLLSPSPSSTHSPSPHITVHPTADTLLTVLHARFRADLPYTRIGPSSHHLVVVNPYKHLATTNDAARREYRERCYEYLGPEDVDSPRGMQAHVFEMAANLYLVMRRSGEAQGVVARGPTSSGKSHTLSLLTTQLIHLSTPTPTTTSKPKPTRLQTQIPALHTILHSFGSSKTLLNPHASRFSQLLELHFSKSTGGLKGAKVLTWGLDRSKVDVGGIRGEERTFHVFYQLLAGATTSERDLYNLDDPSSYALLASSGCYRLPASSGPFSDDAAGMTALRGALSSLGFKPKHTSSIFAILVSILLLGNLTFAPSASSVDYSSASAAPGAVIANREVLSHAARLLGVGEEELEERLLQRTGYVKKEVVVVFLGVEGCRRQRDELCRMLYGCLWAWIVESVNYRMALGLEEAKETTQILILDTPGFETRTPSTTTGSISSISGTLVQHPYGYNAFSEFAINFSAELVHSFVTRSMFDEDVGFNALMKADGVVDVVGVEEPIGNRAVVEMILGEGVFEAARKSQRKVGGLLGVVDKIATGAMRKDVMGGAEADDEEMVKEAEGRYKASGCFSVPAPPLSSSFPSSPFPSPSPSSPSPTNTRDKSLFLITHHLSPQPTTYTSANFTKSNTDLTDASFVQLLRGSRDGFVRKLGAGPGMHLEGHPRDDGVVVRAQVGVGALRRPTLACTGEGEESDVAPAQKPSPITMQIAGTLVDSIFPLLSTLRSPIWSITCLRPNDSQSPNSFDKRRVRQQIGAFLLPEGVMRPSDRWVVGFEMEKFCERYGRRGMGGDVRERVAQIGRVYGWREEDEDGGGGGDWKVGREMVWMGWSAWKSVEDIMRRQEREFESSYGATMTREAVMEDEFDDPTDGLAPPPIGGSGYFNTGSNDNLLLTRTGTDGARYRDPNTPGYGIAGLNTPGVDHRGFVAAQDEDEAWTAEWDRDKKPSSGDKDKENNAGGGGADGMVVRERDALAQLEAIPTSKSRRYWLLLVWCTTFWIPSFVLTHLGRMKRPDVRLAWREKVTIVWLILLLNGTVVFYIVEFGRLLCPNFDKAWSANEVGQHQGDNDFWVSVQGVVYDVSNFVHGDHSDINGLVSNSPDVLESIAGSDMTYYFPPPLVLACNGLVTDGNIALTRKNFTNVAPTAIHVSGQQQSVASSKLADANWYSARFFPKMQTMRKGPLVIPMKTINAQALDTNIAKIWGVYNKQVYDLTDYVYTENLFSTVSGYDFLNDDLVSVFKQRTGQDLTEELNQVLNAMDTSTRQKHTTCLENAFLAGEVDFRKTARCQVQNYLLIIFSVILMTSMALKFLAALQLGSKRQPELQDKFVLCQVPCYTEGEDSLRRTIDSLAGLDYDDKRKLIFIICDGNIIGSGNDRTTPRIVLDILGVDPKLDPEPLLFKSVGEGSQALNYAKVYSGLYEFEGHVVPYMVVVKVGKPTERSKPGNRGKRDSQILLLHYLNRVHFDAPMSPLELEIYHQMRNVIGIDPAFYEYIFTVDADTSVSKDSLNRLVASSADDQRIIGICGETRLQNEQRSWWTMIQVYEYYISHHLSKAFESLFGSVTCLPGCFSLYRIRTADKGRPIIISNRIIDEYSEPHVDTLHKKNLFSLGEDRFLTTILMKHFPTFKTKFCPDAIAHTVAPESWRILFSQRRRWINSTIHNLCELVILPELIGFCCFSMRFFVFIDLLGTLILPATVVYLIYLIIVVATRASAFPQIAIIMIALVYGLQAIIFLLKREFMLIGWMVVYIVSFPVYGFFLPVYSFWCMDDFGWGTTRQIIGEGKDKKVLNTEDTKFDESMIPLKKFSEYEAEAWETATRHSDETGYETKSRSRSQAPSRDHSPHPSPYQQASQTGDYYRDTNITFNNSSNPNLRLGGSQLSHSNISLQRGAPPMSQFSAPQLPFMPFAGGPGSIAGSDYGHSPMGMQPVMGYQNTGSMYGMMAPPMAPRNTMLPNMNMLGTGSFGGSQGGDGGALDPPPALGQQRMSTFSLATTVNPFAGPSNSTNPTEEELVNALRNYLSTQDLMTVTKKTTREAMMARFPKADLTPRKEFLNQSIDKILSES